jgi:hypothetical protein
MRQPYALQYFSDLFSCRSAALLYLRAIHP